MATPEAIAERLFHRTTKGIRLGLERMQVAVEKIGNPQAAYQSMHVAGTNGKGSTCAYMESVLRAHGVTTGLFTSPHIRRFEERFMINGKPVSGTLWTAVYDDVAGIVEDLDLTFFEAVTLIAFELFKRQRVEWGVFETGMGGRLDATTIIVPSVTVITSLDMDHVQFLGNDLQSIAREKLGIVKNNIPLVMVRPHTREVEALVKRHCEAQKAPLFFVSKDDAKDCRTEGALTSFMHNGTKMTIMLPGGYQVENCLAALTALETVGVPLDQTTIDGVAKTFVPGRFQVIERAGRPVVFDVGHNPGAAQAFAETVRSRFQHRSLCVVTGIMKDKDIAGILKSYSRVASKLILTRPNVDRAADCEALRKQAPGDFTGQCVCIPDVDNAVKAALAGSEQVVCVAGSFYTVGEAMAALGVEPY